MIEAAPKHLFPKVFVLKSPTATLNVLDVSGWRERAEFEIDGFTYRLYRERLVSGAFVLEGADGVVVRASKSSRLE